MASSVDSFGCRRRLTVGGRRLDYFSLPDFAAKCGVELGKLPVSLRILLENLLRHEDGRAVTAGDIQALARFDPAAEPEREIAFYPARVVLQDFTGVPSVVDLATMRDALANLGGDPNRINPLFPSELVIDHSVQVDHYGTLDALTRNVELEYSRNAERYALLRWAQQAFDNFRVVPPSTGIVHQVNIEYLARVVFEQDGLVYPDTLVGTDSHTTMVNGLGVLGWGVGGIEAEAAMLGQPINLLVPQVVGVRVVGRLPASVTATDVVLTVTKMLRDSGVVGKFVEFFGDGLGELTLADRATIANMAPEFGSTCALFPIDEESLTYLRMTGRSPDAVELVEQYAKAQGLFVAPGAPEPSYSRVLELDLATIVPTIAGPRRPHDRVALSASKAAWAVALPSLLLASKGKPTSPGDSLPPDADASIEVRLGEKSVALRHGSVVIAAITSCTNTSNPQVMVAAGLLAKKAEAFGLTSQPWVKTSLAPGSQVVTGYLKNSGLLASLEALGFHVVGYGCTTCIGNSGPLPASISQGIKDARLVAVSVLSGNRNFEGRISPDVRANFLASPPLVVAYAIAGRIDIDFEAEPVGKDPRGNPVFLRDIWPSPEEVASVVRDTVDAALFSRVYSAGLDGDATWRALPVPAGARFAWDQQSTYVRRPTFFDGVGLEPSPRADIHAARPLLILGDFVTTDHISPAGNIANDSPAARYLIGQGIRPKDFNSYGARRGNHEVMMRGTFANIRLKNLMVPGSEGGVTKHLPTGDILSIYDAAMRYKDEQVELVVVAGKEYGSGSSRDWAAKGTHLLGVRAVIAESFERIHRSNLIGMGILPLQFLPGQNRDSVGLNGDERLTIRGIADGIIPGGMLRVELDRADGTRGHFDAKTRIDTLVEVDYYRHGGILNFVLRQLVAAPG
jgi:aconitate hydratase